MTNPEPRFHPTDALLSAYVAGLTPWAGALCVRVHLEACGHCRDRVGVLEAEEAKFVDSLPESPMDPARLRALVEALSATVVEAPEDIATARVGDVSLPLPLAQVRIAGRRWLTPDLWVAPIKEGRDEGWRTFILRAPAGMQLPQHGHSGPELVCVLTGAFEDGERYVAGDFVQVAGAVHHSLKVDPEGPCACLIATKGPLKWRGVARLLGPALAV